MKKKITIIVCAVLVFCAIAVPATYSWFSYTLSVEPGITSYVHKSYFESGDGTSANQFQTYDSNGNAIQHYPTEEGCAFEIKYPIQLYYFAWLQALGYFNIPNEDGTTINQVYFYLSDDLDMTGWVLPQIGTQTYQFVGNFDGNGHTISNLTVQNIEGSGSNAWTDKPADINGLNIVGFFGVVGSLGNGGTVNAAVESGGQFTATSGYTYNNAVNEIKNFGLDTVNIKTQTTNSLAGIVAGYVNGPVENVQVSTNGKITNNGATTPLSEYTNNLSDYTLFGYVTEPYRDSNDVVLVKVDTPTETNSRFNYMSQGASAGWGGSINMLDMYNRLANVHGTNFGNMTQITQANHVATVTRRYAADGTMIGPPVESNGAPSDNFYRMYTAANDGSGQYVLSSQAGTDVTQFYYLAGTYKKVIEIHETNDTVSAFYIQHNGTYLNLNNAGTGVTNTTPSGGNTKWMIDADNHIYTQDNDGMKYYLYNDNNTLAIGEQPYYYISCTTNNTTYYLNENNGAIQRGTSATTKWFRSGDNTGTLYTVSNNGNTYYLYTNGNNGNLSLQTNNSTTWTFNNNGRISYTNGNNTYYILHYNNAWTCRAAATYNNVYGTMAQAGTEPMAWTKTADSISDGAAYIQYDNGWKAIADGSTPYYYISYTDGNTTYYLNESNGSIQRGTSATTKWYRSGDSTGTLYTNSSNGNTYYLYSTGNGNLSLQTNNSTTWTFNNNGRISYTSGNYTYYICIRSGYTTWTCRRNNIGSYGTIAQGGTDTHAHTALTFTDTTLPVVNRIEKEEPAEFSYIPLGASTTSPYTVIDSNTGYIIGGSHETESDRKSDIRVSRYGKSNLSSGLTSTNNGGQVSNNNVRTVDGSGIHTLSNANISSYARFADAVKQFNDVLNGTTNLHGLHFMDARISKDNLIVAPKVKLEGDTLTNYQMPEDSIDFLVHQKGYITFFAGTYFTNNNSFFSLHIIDRYKEEDGEVLAGTAAVDDIKSIKEIKEIWKSTDQSKPYVYYLDTDGDGTGDEWSDTKTDDYSLVFNTNWITHPGTASELGYRSSNNSTTGNLFYFEIPVNAGEYALGSVEGRIGAYLLYLDIAANAQLVDRAAIVENFEETTMTYEYPVGATFQNTAILSSNTDPVIPSAVAALTPSQGSTTVTVTNDTTISISNGTVNYVKEGVTVNGTLTYDSASLVPTATTTTRIRRTTYYDYNVAKAQHTVTEVVVKQVDGGAISMTINAWNTGNDWDTEGANATQIATMTTGFTPNVGSATNGVAINEGASQTLDWVKDEANDVYCYLINVGAENNAQTLRLDLDAFEGTIKAGDNYLLLYSFSYAIKDNDNATIDYDYDCDITFDVDAATIAGLFSFANRGYDITVDTSETIQTEVVTPVTSNNYTVSLSPNPS